MPDFKAKMHQICFLLGPCLPYTSVQFFYGGAYNDSPGPLAVFKGPTSKGRDGTGKARKGGGEGEREFIWGRKGKGYIGKGTGSGGGDLAQPKSLAWRPLWNKHRTWMTKMPRMAMLQ